MKILVTGGAGYIGSHTVVQLLSADHEVVIVDNFTNSHPVVVDRIATIAGRRPRLHEADLRDRTSLRQIFTQHRPQAVIHFAGLKAVAESVAQPLHYYDNNVGGSVVLLQTMAEHAVRRLIFSSSATVYGEPESVPIPETAPIRPVNPYGHTKAITEQILRDAAAADPQLAVSVLRYFNPIGAHPSGLIGEDPQGTPNNLLPYLAQVAVGQRPQAFIYGNDYPTPDGTGVRDYIHVMDLVDGHLAALNHLQPGWSAYNLGTGRGASVLEVLTALEAASGQAIPYQIKPRRAGDAATVFADASHAHRALKWHTTHSLNDACRDLWNWQHRNPTGYPKT